MNTSINKHIILVGFMCSGKTTLGRQLAQQLAMPFIDIDEYIANKYNKAIAAIFAEYGEQYFRKLEHECLKEIAQQPPTVIAAGGGTPCFNNNMELINKAGTSIYLQADAQTLFQWIQQSGTQRPLLQNKTNAELLNYISSLLAQRQTYYQQAHITVSALNPNVGKLANQLLSS